MSELEPEFFQQFIAVVKEARASVSRFADQYGENALTILANAIDERGGFHSEILLHRADLDDAAMERHGIYLFDILERGRVTKTYVDMCFDVAGLIEGYVPQLVDEIVAESKT